MVVNAFECHGWLGWSFIDNPDILRTIIGHNTLNQQLINNIAPGHGLQQARARGPLGSRVGVLTEQKTGVRVDNHIGR